MRVTLIHSRFAEGNSICPPLGILGMGTLLVQHGHKVQLFDLDVFRTNPLPAIKAYKPDIIGIDPSGSAQRLFPPTVNFVHDEYGISKPSRQ